ncbi:transcriptional repressor [Pseudonocardia acidicola]|nr:transcriptional repressor [Pseudonocardia acidicola]
MVWLAEHPHSTAEAVRSGVLAHLGAVPHQAVYDMVNSFTGAGSARRIEPAGGPALFERRVGADHHVVCRRCGRHDHQRPIVDEAAVAFRGPAPALHRSAAACCGGMTVQSPGKVRSS